MEFAEGQSTRTFTISVINDTQCNKDPNKQFFASLSAIAGIQFINITVSEATITIDDSSEPECGQFSYPYLVRYLKFLPAADIVVGYERTVYRTPEDEKLIELCVVVYEPVGGFSPRPFVISFETSSGTAGM